MAKPTRGFLGRGKAARDPRLPPGQYDAGDQWPVLNAEVTPQLDVASWSFSVEGLVAHPTTWTWDEIHALPGSAYSGDIHCVTTWSKLGVQFSGVSVDTLLGIAGLEPAASHVMAFSHTGYTTNLPLGRCHRWSSMGRLGLRERPSASRTRRTGTPVGPASLFLEECEMGGRVEGARPRRTGVLGAQRVPRSGRSVARAAIPGRLGGDHRSASRRSLADGHGHRDTARDSNRQDFSLDPYYALASPCRAVLRGATHRTRRVHGIAVVFGGVGTKRFWRDRAHSGETRRRRGLGVPT